MPYGNHSRRKFLKKTGAASIGLGLSLRQLLAGQTPGSKKPVRVDPKLLVKMLSETIIPTSEGYPGYSRLEQYGITDEVLKGLEGIQQRDLNFFNENARKYFKRPFVELSENDRTSFLNLIVESFPPGTFGQARNSTDTLRAGALAEIRTHDKQAMRRLQDIFQLVRARVLTVFYQNFPQNKIARDNAGVPVLSLADQHQILNPNTTDLVTGWDIANYNGPLSWEEEEALRAKWMSYWR
jgi:hypothetical protein